ncbi:MAG: flagellar hook-basal body complex protein [Oligoflexia bacterium]|nr:flagellar hook-basal body complex protein [Oligoflexia bacterium]
MDRGTYVAASGGLVQLRKLDVVNNNLANVNTVGFKKEVLVGESQTFDETLAKLVENKDPFARPDHERTPGVVHVRSVTDFTPGPIRQTGNPLDVALRNPNDFFVVNTANGPRYTRAGNFSVNENNELCTVDGLPVAGDGGAITVNTGSINIASNGAVLVNGAQVGRLQVARIAEPTSLVREAGTRFALPAGQPAPTTVEAEVLPSSLEMSNVSVVSSMVDLITTSRGFDLYTKAAQSIDQLNQTAIGQVGRRLS